jgi:hypothetical protein
MPTRAPSADAGTLRARPDLLDLRTVTARWRVRTHAEDRMPEIPGRRGNVQACDLTRLCVYVTGRVSLRKVLRELPAGWRRHQIGDDEANLLAPAADLDLACRLVRAYRRRRKTGGRDFPSTAAMAGPSAG